MQMTILNLNPLLIRKDGSDSSIVNGYPTNDLSIYTSHLMGTNGFLFPEKALEVRA